MQRGPEHEGVEAWIGKLGDVQLALEEFRGLLDDPSITSSNGEGFVEPISLYFFFALIV